MRISYPISLHLFVVICLITAPAAEAGMQEWTPTASVQIGIPQLLSVSVGFCTIDFGTIFGADSGFLIRIEPGIAGGKLHAGVRHVFSMAFVPVVSADLTTAALHMWKDSWAGPEEGQTYLGLETRFGAYLLTVTAGMYRHVAGGGTEYPWLFSAGAGLGF